MRSETRARDGAAPRCGAAEGCVQTVDVVAPFSAEVAGGEGAEAATGRRAVPVAERLSVAAAPSETAGRARDAGGRSGVLHAAVRRRAAADAAPARAGGAGRV